MGLPAARSKSKSHQSLGSGGTGLGTGRAGEWDSSDLSGEAEVTLVPGFQMPPLES